MMNGKPIPDWFPKALAAAMSEDRMNALVKDHELGTMLLGYHLLTGVPRPARKRVMAWIWTRIEAEERGEDNE